MKMEKKYEELKLEVILFDAEDVVTTSSIPEDTTPIEPNEEN